MGKRDKFYMIASDYGYSVRYNDNTNGVVEIALLKKGLTLAEAEDITLAMNKAYELGKGIMDTPYVV